MGITLDSHSVIKLFCFLIDDRRLGGLIHILDFSNKFMSPMGHRTIIFTTDNKKIIIF